jgi:hypothetical protein
MTPEEEADQRLAAAKARLAAAQRGAPAPTTAAQPSSGARRVSRREPEVFNVEDDTDMDSFGAFALGAADTITFGFLDEAGAAVDTYLPVILGGRGGTYEDNLRRNRAILGKAEEDFGGAYLGGQIVGGFAPTSRLGAAAGVGRAGAANIRRATLEGAAMGFAYGVGSSEDEDLFTSGRFESGLQGGAFGAAGGFIIGTAIFQGGRIARDGYQRLVQFRQGRSPRLDLEFRPVGGGQRAADDAVEAIEDIRRTLPGTRAAPSAPDPKKVAINRLTGRQSNELEPGAFASADEILDVPKKEALFAKIANLTPEQAKVAAKKLMDAWETGELTKEPHYRSIFGLDLSEFGDLEEVVPEVANILYDLGQGVLNKADLGKRTVKSFEARLRAQYGTNMTEGQLDDLVERVKAVEGSASVGRLQMTLAGVQFARVSKDLLPRIMGGEREARTILAEELSKALRVSAKGQMLMSAAGRELGMLSKRGSLLFKEMAEGTDVEDLATITKRVNEAIAKLDDDALNELLAQTRDLSKLEALTKILLDPVHAEKVNLFYRARNTFEAFFKSTVLTPMTAAVNLVGIPIHSWVRTGGARRLAEIAARQSGDARTATILSMQRQAASAVRWEAHKQATAAMFKRVKWETLGSIRSVASVAGSTKAAQRASASRQAMIASGYRPPAIREFDLDKRLAVTDIQGFNEKLAARVQSDAPFASFVNAVERAGATALNTLDALGTASAKLFTGVLDDYGRALIMTREVYSEMAGRATAQAFDEGLTGPQLADRVKQLTEEWAAMPPKEILERVEQKLVNGEELDELDLLLVRRDYRAEKEAERVLFLDGPQTTTGKVAANAASIVDEIAGFGLFKGLTIPYISTPIRIMERGLASYTPWAKFTEETRKALASADPVERAMERARMDLGGMLISAGMVAAATGAITITNGGYQNSANLGGAPALRLNLPGGAFVEFGRLDPIAMSVALGGVIGQMHLASQDAGRKYGQDDAIATAFAVAFSGFRDAVLEKSYLSGLSELVEALTSQDPEALTRYYSKYLPDAAGRMIPFSGTFRQLNETITGRSLEAATALDRIAKVTPGMGAYLPARVDSLGNEIEGRTFGLAVGTVADEDDVTRKVRELGINITNLRKADPAGFDLTSEELSELRKIRANEAVNAQGLTMKQALAMLFEDPAFQSMQDRQQVQDAVVEVMSQFNEPAREIFEYRNQTYLADREASRSFKEYIKQGLAPAEARDAAFETTRAFGLEPTRTDALE